MLKDGYGHDIDDSATLFDGYGRIITDIDDTVSEPIKAFLKYDISKISKDWRDNCDRSYTMMSDYVRSNDGSIPFFVSTDQHSGCVEQHRYVHNIDSLNIPSIALGDLLTGRFNYNESQLISARERTYGLVNNFISVIGNHDSWCNGDGGNSPTTELFQHYFFSNLPMDRDVASSSYSVVGKNVRWIVLDNYTALPYDDDAQHMPSTTTINWLVNQLSKNDLSCIVLCHWNLFQGLTNWRTDDSTGTYSPSNSNRYDYAYLTTLMEDRKNRRSGTIPFHNGSVSYDFSGCQKDLICTLHGHMHREEWQEHDDLLSYAFDWFGGSNNSATFGAINPNDGTFHAWVFNDKLMRDELVLDL